MSNTAQIKCPTCKRLGNWFATPFGPFCSRRCKLIDLGKWFGEEHAISEPLSAETFQNVAEPPPGKPRESREENKKQT